MSDRAVAPEEIKRLQDATDNLQRQPFEFLPGMLYSVVYEDGEMKIKVIPYEETTAPPEDAPYKSGSLD